MNSRRGLAGERDAHAGGKTAGAAEIGAGLVANHAGEMRGNKRPTVIAEIVVDPPQLAVMRREFGQQPGLRRGKPRHSS